MVDGRESMSDLCRSVCGEPVQTRRYRGDDTSSSELRLFNKAHFESEGSDLMLWPDSQGVTISD